MKLTVLGARNRNLTSMIKMAANSFADKLLSPQMIKHIELEVHIRDNLGAGAYCAIVDDTNPPRNFLIEIQRTRKKIHMFTALAHEMVHLKQWAKGEMKDKIKKTKYITVWRGETFEDDISYWDQPWEFEAYGLQESLVAKFLIEHDQFKNLRQRQEDWFVYDDPIDRSRKM
jgi:hypothetical protein